MDIKTLKSELIKQYKYRIELHTHTSGASSCSQISPETMAETYAELGYDGIIITNHFTYPKNTSKTEFIDRYIQDYELTKHFGEKLGLEVLLGAEIRFTENCNDYLVYGVDREILESIFELLPYGVENFRKELPLPNSVFLQAHPFRDNITAVDASLLDGVEVYNMHPGHNSRIGLASKYAIQNSLEIMTAGTDYHNPGRDGLASLRCKHLPKTSFEVASLLKSNDYILEIAKNNLIIP